MSYYFEDESADIIGKILESSRNGTVNLSDVAESIGYPKEIVKGFLNSLEQLSLLTETVPTKEAIVNYRKLYIAVN